MSFVTTIPTSGLVVWNHTWAVSLYDPVACYQAVHVVMIWNLNDMREFTCSVGIIATCINFSCLVSVQTLTLSVGRIAPRPGGVIVLRYGLSLLASVPQTPSQRCAIANLQERFHPIQRQPSHQSPQRSNHMGFANDRILCFFRTEYVDVVHSGILY